MARSIFLLREKKNRHATALINAKNIAFEIFANSKRVSSVIEINLEQFLLSAFGVLIIINNEIQLELSVRVRLPKTIANIAVNSFRHPWK
jgi:hypothetical protein